ncbi:MAG: hypothetical protein E4G90_02410 [Gemmatimonadales bacterium]|nr:MAG: hypothetical protein E4G90_02410 [Gemmatimonadales bacterium]
MNIIVQNSKGDPVFTFDVEKGRATAHISMDAIATEFLKGLETAVKYGSQFKDGGTIQDFLIEAGQGANSGNFIILMRSEGEDGERGGDAVVSNPVSMKKCTDCKDGTQTLAYTRGPCTTCHGSQKVPA